MFIRRLAFIPLIALVLTLAATLPAGAAVENLDQKLAELDVALAQMGKDWNVPGFGVGIVVGDQLVFAKGYGYRDYGKKLPFTENTVCPIASNTKLFTAVAAGLQVEDGKLGWDEPIRTYVPQIKFYNDDLDASVTLRDMLSHRTGITRHDMIWYKSEWTRQELFDRLQYMEPKEPIRTLFLYNNMMYAGVGQVIEIVSGKTWETTVQERIFNPLGMTHTVLSIEEMTAQPDFGVPYTERRDSYELYEIPYYREADGLGPAGSINSNLQDLSRWLTALLNHGVVDGKQVIPDAVLKETIAPAIAMPNAALEARGFGELLNAVYGTGRWTASYRGHRLAYHGGDINGFHSQVSIMPEDGIGVAVLVIGDHAAGLYNIATYHVYERLLGMSLTPWSERGLEIRKKGKEAGTEARAKAGAGQVKGTKPSHALDAYVGEFEHPAYGVVAITKEKNGLGFEFHKIKLPLDHFHYDRFDSPDDEQEGKWSVNFLTNPAGEIDKITMSLDEKEATFTRRVAAGLTDPAVLAAYAGFYETPTGAKFEIALKEDGTLGLVFPGQPFQPLVPWQPHKFRVKEFSDVVMEFEVKGDEVTALKQIDPSGEYRFPRKS